MKLLSSPLFLFFIFILTSPTICPPAQAVEDPIDLSTFPEALGEAFGIGGFAGGILATALLMVALMLPVAIWTKTWIPPLFVGFIVLGFCVAVAWLPYWFLFIICLMVALLFSGKARDWASGGGST